jgi:hypothetical protein
LKINKQYSFNCTNTKLRSYQARFSLELLTSISNSLLDGTVFEITRGLVEIQHITEKNLYFERTKIENDYKGKLR